jgi:hypothetical protein
LDIVDTHMEPRALLFPNNKKGTQDKAITSLPERTGRSDGQKLLNFAG